MTFTRRQFLQASAAASAAAAFPSLWLRAQQARALTQCEQGPVNLVIVQLGGGNDGLNMVIPKTDGTGHNRSAYNTFRPTIGVPASELQNTQVGNDPLHNGEVALHPHMNGLKALYDSGNVAVVLGAHYPNRSLDHDESERIWYRADPPLDGSSFGWMGRTLDDLCTGQPTAIPAVDTDSQLTPLFYGNTAVLAFSSLSQLNFPTNGNLSSSDKSTYRTRFTNIYNAAASAGQNFVAPIGTTGGASVSRIDAYKTVSANQSLAMNLNDLLNGTTKGGGGFGISGVAQNSGARNISLAKKLRLVFQLMKGQPQQPSGFSPLGCRIFRVSIGGFDSHSEQGIHVPLSTRSIDQKVQFLVNGAQAPFDGEYHGKLLYWLDRSIAAFWQDCLEDTGPTPLYQNTLIMTFSEFGRRVLENGQGNGDPKAGTDHGTAAPMFVVGPTAAQAGAGLSSIVGYGASAAQGMYGAHPEIDQPHLDRDKNSVFQIDFRHVYGEIMTKWMGLSTSEANTILGAGGFSYSSPGFLT